MAEASKSALEQSGQLKGPVATQILDATVFYPAEDYHQDYSTKNPLRYRYYRYGCGRDARLEAVWRGPLARIPLLAEPPGPALVTRVGEGLAPALTPRGEA